MRRLGSCLLVLLISSCVHKDDVPAELLKPDAMKAVMWDMIQADQYTKQFIVRDSAKLNVPRERMKYYEEVFKIHHTTSQIFRESYRFYMQQPDLSNILFDSLSALATRKRQEVYKARLSLPVKTIKPPDTPRIHFPTSFPRATRPHVKRDSIATKKAVRTSVPGKGNMHP